MVTATVDSREQSFDGPSEMPLPGHLRDVLGLIGAQFGCGMALRGARAIHLDGLAVCACVTPLAAATGKRIRGLPIGRQLAGWRSAGRVDG